MYSNTPINDIKKLIISEVTSQSGMVSYFMFNYRVIALFNLMINLVCCHLTMYKTKYSNIPQIHYFKTSVPKKQAKNI